MIGTERVHSHERGRFVESDKNTVRVYWNVYEHGKPDNIVRQGKVDTTADIHYAIKLATPELERVCETPLIYFLLCSQN